jgi:hypothetical protein
VVSGLGCSCPEPEYVYPYQGEYEILSELPEGMEVLRVAVEDDVFSIRWRRYPEEDFRTDTWSIVFPEK